MPRTFRLGLLPLCDAAPVILANHERLFAARGLKVQLVVEPSWANIADKLGYGMLDGAVMLPPLAIACALGLRGRQTELVVPISLSSNGNTVTLASDLRSRFRSAGIAGLAHHQKLRLAVVHMFSTHDLLLRYWLASVGLDPELDVEISVMPPSEMPGSLAGGRIDGFCAGAPWGQVALANGDGFTAIYSKDIWFDHPEKCLALREDVLARDEGAVLSLLAALRESSASCASPPGRVALAELLAKPEYLDLPGTLLRSALDPWSGGPDFSQQYPDPAHAEWFAAQMFRWHELPSRGLEAAASIYRPDLFLASGGTAPQPKLEQFCDSQTAF